MSTTLTRQKHANMQSLENFKNNLQDMLGNIYNPEYKPADDIYLALGVSPSEKAEVVQTALIEVINKLQPEPNVPMGSRSRQVYDVLHQRFVLGLTQVQTAESLFLSVRSVQRIQQRAVYMLAKRLWEERPLPSNDVLPVSAPSKAASSTGSNDETGDWQAQLHKELILLQQNEPAATADVKTVIDGVLRLEETLVAQQQVKLTPTSIEPDLVATIHPTVLRQILITAVEKSVQHMAGGEISIQAALEKAYINITVQGCPVVTGHNLPESNLIREILRMKGGEFEITLTENRLVFEIKLPFVTKDFTVLIVDDNMDQVNFYLNHTLGTRYEITYLTKGRLLFETIEAAPPDVIVLDVMLPDTDGWELLTYLRQHPLTRSIPVIVCSVIKREELALALGASSYLPKPIRPRQFVQTLDHVLALPSSKNLDS